MKQTKAEKQKVHAEYLVYCLKHQITFGSNDWEYVDSLLLKAARCISKQQRELNKRNLALL